MASPPPPGSPTTPGSVEYSRRRQRWVMLGLLLTIIGLILVALLFPSDPQAVTSDLPYIAAGLVALWVGGILMGLGMGMRVRQRRSPPTS